MRHPLHSICPYFAMFPEDFVAKQLFAYTKRGDYVFDPFCGRGTTVFESLLNGRPAAGTDVNPVAACVAGAKADPPSLNRALARLDELEEKFVRVQSVDLPRSEFFRACFHRRTLREIAFLRSELNWRRSKTDRFLAAVGLGCLHGESHKTPNCLSNRMPRTISTKPDYSVRWWKERGLVAPERATFEVLRGMLRFRFSQAPAELRGVVRLRDARTASEGFASLKERVALIVTSPPYLDTTDYCEDQWLRLWFLGGEERPLVAKNEDDRYTSAELYWEFLAESWEGCADMVRGNTVIVVRIGGTALEKGELFVGVRDSLKAGLDGYSVRALHSGLTTEIKNRQTNVFRPGTRHRRVEHDFAFRVR